MTGASTATISQNQSSDPLAGASFAPTVRGFQRILDFVASYNQSAGPEQQINGDEIVGKLKTAGAVNDEILRSLTASSMSEATGLPTIVATALVKGLQQSDSPHGAARRITRLAAQTLAVPELFNRYDPSDVGSAVGGELLRLAHQYLHRNPRIIAFEASGKVNGPLSYRLFEDALRGDPDIEQVSHQGAVYYTYRINERPHDVVQIHPITGGNLRSNGTAQDGLDWSPAPDSVRFLLRHAVTTGELNPNLQRRDMVYYHRIACDPNGLAALIAEFPKAARKYQEGVQIGQQPPIRRVRQEDGDPTAGMRDSLTGRRGAH